MPTYEYQCGVCGGVFDVFQSIKAAPLRKAECEQCGQKQPVRLLIGTGGAVIFKGSGFYQTDYRSSKYNEAAKADSGDTKKSDGDSAKKSDGAKAKKADSAAESKPSSTSSAKSD